MRISLFLLLLILTDLHTNDSKFELLCHTWRMVGMKPFKGDYHPAKSPEDEILTFKKDGSYEQVLYGQLKMGGKWNFTADSSKFYFSMTSLNGASVPSLPSPKEFANDSIISLTADTLIEARIAWYGPKKEYGHTDVYYVRVDGK